MGVFESHIDKTTQHKLRSWAKETHRITTRLGTHVHGIRQNNTIGGEA